MVSRTKLTVQKGIWIDEKSLVAAGLQGEVEVAVQPGEIHMCRATSAVSPSQSASAAWEVFHDMGREAQPGRLMNPSTEHDKYLYGSPNEGNTRRYKCLDGYRRRDRHQPRSRDGISAPNRRKL
jgi:hypothetical protein